MAVDWGYYDKPEFDTLNDMYLPYKGEGATKAMQIITAVNKLVYRYYNDGDVFDNSHCLESGENLTSYANWLYEHTEAKEILDRIKICYTHGDYENLLKDLADKLLNGEYLAEQNKIEKTGTIYNCDGKFEYIEYTDDDEEDYY